MGAIPLLVLGEMSVEGELPVFFCAGEGGVWESKARKPTLILSVRSAILERREGMLAWRCWILRLAGSSSSIEHMEIRLLSMWMCAFSLSAIHLNTYKDKSSL